VLSGLFNGLFSIRASSPQCVSNELTSCCRVLSPCNLIYQALWHSLSHVETSPVLSFSLYKQLSLLCVTSPMSTSTICKLERRETTHWQSSNAIHWVNFLLPFLFAEEIYYKTFSTQQWLNTIMNWNKLPLKSKSLAYQGGLCNMMQTPHLLLNLTKYKIVH
jgi:hypothetical protein